MDENNILIHQNSFDILAISEIWLSDKIPIVSYARILPILIVLKWSGLGLTINLLFLLCIVRI